MSSHAIPNEFMCPITMVVMKEPVLATDGYTYEKEAIQQWLRSNTISPMTREPMRFSDCRPNRALRDAIERWEKEKQPTGKSKQPPKKTRHPHESSPPSATQEALSYQTDTDHMYAIMVHTQETVEQIKRSSVSPTPSVQQQQVQSQLTDEQKKKYAMAICFLFSGIIILIMVVDRMQANASN